MMLDPVKKKRRKGQTLRQWLRSKVLSVVDDDDQLGPFLPVDHLHDPLRPRLAFEAASLEPDLFYSVQWEEGRRQKVDEVVRDTRRDD